MSARRALFGAALLAAAALGIGLRLSTKAQLSASGVARPFGSDDAYHLRRATFAAAHFPATVFFDPLMNVPEGGVPIWPPLFDAALALPSRVLDGAGAPAPVVARRAAWVPLVFAAGSIFLTGLVGRRLFGDAGGAAAPLFLAVCPGHILWTQYGHTDQHVAESFFGLLVLCLFLAGRDEPDSRARRLGEAATGLALGLSVLAWQGAIYWGAILALCLFLEAAALRRSVDREAALTLGLGAAVAALGTALWLGPRRMPFTYISFGWFQPLFLAALAGGTILLDLALAALRKDLDRRGAVRRAVLLAVCAVAVAPQAGALAQGFVRGVGYAAGSTPQEVVGAGGYLAYPKGWLKGIFEAQPLLAEGPGLALRQLSLAYFLAPAFVCVWALRALRGPRHATHILLAVWATVTLFLSLSQRLNVYYAAVLAAVCWVEAARLVGERLARRFSGSGWLAPAGAALAAAVLAFPMADGLKRELSATHVPGSELFTMLDWMRDNLPRTVDPYDARLLGPPPFPAEASRAASVLAPWSLGHLVLYVGQQPVVANNFGYGFRECLSFFLAESEAEAVSIAKKHHSRWIVAADLLPRMNDYAATLGRPPLLETTPRGLRPTQAYFRTLQARLYDFDGQAFEAGGVSVAPLEHFRLVYQSKSGVPRGERFVAQWKVFEILPEKDGTAPASPGPAMSAARPDSSRFALGSVLRERPLWTLVALVLAFFARPIFFHQTFFFRDLYLLAFPQRMRLVELIHTAGVPLWDAYLHGGQPFLAEPTNMALYPTALLYVLLPAVTAFNVEIVLHFALGAVGAYALARVLGISARASLIAGAVFTFCGFTLSTANLLNRLLALPAGAFLLLFWHLLLLDRKARWFLAAAAAGVLQVLAGSIEFLLLNLAIALGWSLCYPYETSGLSLWRRAAIWAGLVVAVLGISAIQVLPAMEVIGQSSREPGLRYEATSTWSLSPRRLPELVVPGYFGPTETLNEREYWGRRLEDEGYPLIVSVYFGFSALLLALSEGLDRNGTGPPRRLRRFLLAVVAAAIVLALGRFLFLSRFVHGTLPLSGVFRYPIKMLYSAVLPVALLSAASADRRFGGAASQPGRRAAGVWLGSAAGLCAVLALLLSAGGPAADSITRALFLESLSVQEQHLLAARWLHAALAAASAALLWLLARPSPRALAALSGILILDLGLAGYFVNPFAPRDLLIREPLAARAVRSELHGGRLFRDASPAQISLTAPTDEISWLAFWRRETLDFYTAAAFGIPVIYHLDYDGLAPRRLLRLTSLIPSLPWDQRLPILSAGAVTLIVTAEQPALPELQLVGEIPNSSTTRLFLYRNLAAAPRVGFVSMAVAVRSETEALRGILSRGFDPRNHVVLEGDARAVSGNCPAAVLTPMERGPNAETIRVAAACDGYLVFSETHSPGWKGFVDGTPEPVVRANLAFSAVRVPAGNHVVARVYRPVSVLMGGGLSLISVALALVLARLIFRGQRAATHPPPAVSPTD